MRRTLKHNARTEVPTRHIAFDCETRPVPIEGRPGACVHRLLLGRALFWRWEGGRATRPDWLTFRRGQDFWTWALRHADPGHTLWVWAHNLGFDLSASRAWELFECGDLRLFCPPPARPADGATGKQKKAWQGAICTEDPPCFFSARSANGSRVVACDTLNWAPISLAKIGEALGIRKVPMPGEIASEEDWERYCTRDVEITQALVCRLLRLAKEVDWGNWRYTAAAQAMQLYKHRCQTVPIVVDTDPHHKELERLAYHGARSEVYFNGAVIEASVWGLERMAGVPDGVPVLPRGPTYRLDTVGAYPAAMHGKLYPVSYLRTEYDLAPERLADYLRGLGAVAEVVIDTGGEAFPCRRPDRTYWARGRYVSHLAGPELKVALDLGVVRQVRRVNLYALGEPFTEFVDACRHARRQYEEAGEALAARLMKLIANSLHGKFAQRSHRWELRPDVAAPQPWGVWHQRCPETGRVRTFRAIGWAAQEKLAPGESDDSFPAIAAYCTSYHRLHMRALKWAAGERDVVYEDADSLHVTHSGFLALQKRGWIDGERLGALRVESVAKIAVYHAPKHYQWDAERVCSGLSRKAVQDERGQWHQTEFTGLEALLNHGLPAGPVTYDQAKETPAGQVPGRVNPDGWVDPVRLTQ